MLGPQISDDLQELERDFPVFSVVIGDKTAQFCPAGFFCLHLIHEREQVARKPCGISGGRWNAGRIIFFELKDLAAELAFPCPDKAGHGQFAFHGGHCRWQRLAVSMTFQDMLFFVHIAKWQDFGQQSGFGA